jgi:hypothetical protein
LINPGRSVVEGVLSKLIGSMLVSAAERILFDQTLLKTGRDNLFNLSHQAIAEFSPPK